MRFTYRKFSIFYACQKFFAQLVDQPNLYGQLLFAAHDLSFKSIGIKKKSKNTVAALIIQALALYRANPLP
jgi:ribosomal protein L18